MTMAAAPREYVVGLYNAYAETFDSHLQEALEYRTPAVIVESLAVLFPGRRCVCEREGGELRQTCRQLAHCGAPCCLLAESTGRRAV